MCSSEVTEQRFCDSVAGLLPSSWCQERQKVTQLDTQLRKNMDLPKIQRHGSAKDQAEPWTSSQTYQLVWLEGTLNIISSVLGHFFKAKAVKLFLAPGTVPREGHWHRSPEATEFPRARAPQAGGKCGHELAPNPSPSARDGHLRHLVWWLLLWEGTAPGTPRSQPGWTRPGAAARALSSKASMDRNLLARTPPSKAPHLQQLLPSLLVASVLLLPAQPWPWHSSSPRSASIFLSYHFPLASGISFQVGRS